VDPRVEVEYEFQNGVRIMSQSCWDIRICYAFHITRAELEFLVDPQTSLESMFFLIKTTYQARLEGKEVLKFYRNFMELMLLKYIAIDIDLD